MAIKVGINGFGRIGRVASADHGGAGQQQLSDLRHQPAECGSGLHGLSGEIRLRVPDVSGIRWSMMTGT